MTIEPEQETIIEPEENNEEELELELDSPEDSVEDSQPERPVETPEAKRARLKRQLDQHEKKHGFKESEANPVAKTGELSTKDVLYLAKAEIHEEDMDEVLEMAKARFGGDVKKAHAYLKPILEVNSEKRKTSEASHTGNARRGSQKVSDETLLDNANSGKLPESDDEIARLVSVKAKQ